MAELAVAEVAEAETEKSHFQLWSGGFSNWGY